jgi:3-methyladenine DNA glycosylase AlkD
LKFLPIIARESTDSRNFVKNAVNWGFAPDRQAKLESDDAAIRTALKIKEIESKSAKWIASDALKELKSDNVQNRLKR